MKVVNVIPVFEINDDEVEEKPELFVGSHSHWHHLVCLKLDDGDSITVNADELIKAINNATNW